ncbi:MAG TPA: DUF397 domain-containing protein [Acidimicrobiales bacterium]
MSGHDHGAGTTRHQLERLEWRTSTRCTETYCVAIARADGWVGVRGPDGRLLPLVLPAAAVEPLDGRLVIRNTSDPEGPLLVVSATALRDLLARIKDGAYDELVSLG